MKALLETNFGELYKGDCIKIMKNFEDNSIDCIFADPPFNLNKDYGPTVNDSMTERAYLAWSQKWLNEAIRILKPGGSLFVYNLPKWNLLLSGYISDKLTFRHWIAIDKKQSLPISGRLYPAHYSLLYFIKGNKPNTFNPPRLPLEVCRHCGGDIKDYGGYKHKMNPRGINLSDIWSDIPAVRHKKYKKRQANELHLKFMDRILDIATKEGDIVLDPFGGSGTTYIAAELKRRKWIGIELSTTDDIIKRFKTIIEDEEHLNQIRKKVNTLFTEDAIAIRKKFGKSNSKYKALN
jgi:site-specific DNA-methyltransferase (adenine-specific)